MKITVKENKENKKNYNLIINDVVVEGLSTRDVRCIISELNRNFYRGDIEDRLGDKFQLSSSAFNEVLEKYACLREDNDGDADGLTWSECLDEAFEGYEYGDIFTEEMKRELIASMMKAPLDNVADEMDCYEDELAKLSSEELLAKITLFIECIKNVGDDDVLIDMYKEWV